MRATNQALTFIDKEVGCCLRDRDSMLAVVNPFFGGPLKHILLGIPLCSIYGIHLGCSREVMVTKATCLKCHETLIFTQMRCDDASKATNI